MYWLQLTVLCSHLPKHRCSYIHLSADTKSAGRWVIFTPDQLNPCSRAQAHTLLVTPHLERTTQRPPAGGNGGGMHFCSHSFQIQGLCRQARHLCVFCWLLCTEQNGRRETNGPAFDVSFRPRGALCHPGPHTTERLATNIPISQKEN